MKTFEEKLKDLKDLLGNADCTPIAWSQSNEEKADHIESEVTFKFKQPKTSKEVTMETKSKRDKSYVDSYII